MKHDVIFLCFAYTNAEVFFMSNLQLPLGFGMALAQNERAMEKFESLSRAQKKIVIERSQSISTKHEMRSFVNSIVDSTGF